MKNNKNVITFFVLTFTFLIVILYSTKSEVKTSETATPLLMATSSPSAPSVPVQVISDYGQASLSLGKIITFKDSAVSLLKVVDDSRCPQGVACVWAGTANTELQISDNADPKSGVYVYASSGKKGYWYVLGGTSAGAPQWAGIKALGLSADNQKFYTDKSSDNNGNYFRDIQSGTNGDCG